MQPAAARVGPSNEPSVRRIAVRFSSGATICIEKTIKVNSFKPLGKSFRFSSSQETGQRALRTAFAKKGPSIQRDKKFDQSKPAQVGGHRLRHFGGDSEISE